MRSLLKLTIAACALSALIACQSASLPHTRTTNPTITEAAHYNDVDDKFNTLADEAWAFSTQRERGSLPDISPATLASRFATQQDFYQRITAINPQQLSEENHYSL